MSSTSPSSSLSLVQPQQLIPEEMPKINNNKRTRPRRSTAPSLRSASSNPEARRRETTLVAEQPKNAEIISSLDWYESEETCASCHTKRLYTDWANGDIVCRGCGVVSQESILDDSPEWNTYYGDNTDVSAALRKQRTAGPVRADGTLEPTSLSVMCYGGSGKTTTNNNNMVLRRRLARIQHVRDYQLVQQREKLYRDVAIDLAIRRKQKMMNKQQQKSLTEWMVEDKKSRRIGGGGSSSSSNGSGGDDDDDPDDDIDIDDSDNDDDATSYDADETAPPPRHMILIEEHMEAQIEQEQLQWDETKRRANWRKWTLPTTDGDDGNDNPSDDDNDHDDPLTSKKRKKKQPKGGPHKRQTKRERADIERARQTLTDAVSVLRNVAVRHNLSSNIVNDTIAKFQYYGATHDTLPNAACAAILYLTSHGRYFLEPYGTNRLAVRKMLRRIMKQFPQWHNTSTTGVAVTGAAAAAAAAAAAVAGTGATGSTASVAATAAATAMAMTTVNAEAAIHAVLDRLKLSAPGTKKTSPSTALWRDATLAVLRDDNDVHTVVPPATILAAVYFCATVAQKLAQLGLTTTNTIAPTSVAQLAKQASVPASRIRTAYQTAPRDVWLDRVAQTVLPQALLVRQLLPNKAV
jgi:transcription initiation factor TFIIIB Brf1 subunit/transcription initiation factor TFIIB